jgi:glycerol-3-phosphate dehydrogenase
VARLDSLRGERFDVAIVGGGIIGCGIARDAALRGLRVALVEKRDFGSGTTSASTRIVHGGLRYLEMLDFRLVRLDLRERETLLRIAPHLVEPLEFLIPFFRGSAATALKMRLGLALYDALSYDKQLPSRRWLTGAAARSVDRALADARPTGAAAYHDARVDSPERLALENVLDAEHRLATAVNYCEAVSITVDGDRSRLRVRDVLPGQTTDECEIDARVVVNATGAWLELAAAALTGRRPGLIRTTKGVHLVCRPLTDRALVLFSAVDKRLLFAIPRAGLTWIGTTDTDFTGDPANARAERSDIDYLLQSVRHVFPTLSRQDVLHTTAGVRALVKAGGSESSVSRMHRIVSGAPAGPPGVISVLGGKITGYRAIAEEVTDTICRQLGATDRKCTTGDAPLPGAAAARAGLEGVGADPATMTHLVNLYGSRAGDIIGLVREEPRLASSLSPRYDDIGAEVVLAVRQEHCVRLSDFMRRRTLLGATADQGWDAASPAAAIMRDELGWSAAREADELAAYRSEVEWRLPL